MVCILNDFTVPKRVLVMSHSGDIQLGYPIMIKQIHVSGLNYAASCVVEHTLFDRLLWYSAYVKEEQRRSPRFSVGGAARFIQRTQHQVRFGAFLT